MEYAIMTSLIAGVLIASATLLGNSSNENFEKISEKVGEANN